MEVENNENVQIDENAENDAPETAPEQNNENISSNESDGGVAVKEDVSEEIPQITDEARAFEEQSAEIERKQAELREQDQKLLDALDDVLEKSAAVTPRPRQQQAPQKNHFRALLGTSVHRGVGFLSLGVNLVFLGIVVLICLFSPSPNYLLPMKLSPVCAIIIGAEILIHLVVSRSKIRINLPCVAISAAIIIGCCIMSVAMSKSYNVEKEMYNNRSIAADIYERSYQRLKDIADIETLDVTVDLNPDGTGKYKGVDALSADDYVYVSVKLAGQYGSIEEFATDCKSIIEEYNKMEIYICNFAFVNDSRFSSLTLDVDGRYEQDYSIERLSEKVNYIYVETNEFALEDLVDYDEEVSE